MQDVVNFHYMIARAFYISKKNIFQICNMFQINDRYATNIIAMYESKFSN